MRRTIIIIIEVAILVAIAVWLARRPGDVEIAWQGYIIETSVGVLLLAVLALLAVVVLLYRLWIAVRRAPGAFGRARSSSRRERGYQALTQGMVAVAAGDAEAARKHSRKANDLLNEPPLTMLLSAQTAQLNGDEQAAHNYFEAMLNRPETEFLGLRGLLTQALRKRDPVRALDLAHRARSLRPKTPWVQRTSFELEVTLRRWTEAMVSLDEAVRLKAVEPADANRYRAAILMERSREAEANGSTDYAIDLAHRAVGRAPEFVPAVNREARLLASVGRRKHAARLIEKSWGRTPHRALAEAYGLIAPENEDGLDRVKRFERLHKLQPDHPESLIALGEAELAARLWGAARSHLTRAEAAMDPPTRRIYRLLAEGIEGETPMPPLKIGRAHV